MTTELRVPDATCGHCKATIETAVAGLRDVTRAELDLATQRLTVEHDSSVGIDELSGAIKAAGYTPEPVA